jgi:Legume lectin domain/Chitobiase/beta-hexosaminidase C-terminal domain
VPSSSYAPNRNLIAFKEVKMHKVRTLKVLNMLPALIAMAMLAVCTNAFAATTGSGATLVFSYPNGFAGTSGTINLASDGASLVGSAIDVTNGAVGAHEGGGAWFAAQQNITSFTTDFTFRMASGQPVPSIIGMTFAVQNSGPGNPFGLFGSHAVADANMAGYGGYDLSGQFPLLNSIAVKFDMNSSNGGSTTYPAGGSPNSTGLYINGGPAAALNPENDLNPYGINLYSGHIMDAHIVYDGSLLTMVLRDTVTNAQARYTWPLNIPAAIGGNTAWVGFTAGEIPAVVNSVLTWSYWSGYNARLSAPTFSVTPGSYTSPQNVTMSGPAGASIYYTTNGLQPTSSSTLYTGPITVSSNEVIQAVAIQSGSTDSLVASANYQISTPNIINFPSGFAANDGVILNGRAIHSGSSIQMTDTNSAGNESAAAWYAVPVNVQTFSTNFTLQFTNATANGMTFCIQNQNPTATDANSKWVSGGPTALGNSSGGLGYSGSTGAVGGQVAGLLNSVAVKFDIWSGNTTGIFVNGANPTTPQTTITGVTLNSGHPINVAMTYNGTTLSMTLTDTVTKGTFSTSWAVNIPSEVGGNTAYVGFTASTGGASANQFVNAWTYATTSSVQTPAAPTNLHVQ